MNNLDSLDKKDNFVSDSDEDNIRSHFKISTLEDFIQTIDPSDLVGLNPFPTTALELATKTQTKDVKDKLSSFDFVVVRRQPSQITVCSFFL